MFGDLQCRKFLHPTKKTDINDPKIVFSTVLYKKKTVSSETQTADLISKYAT